MLTPDALSLMRKRYDSTMAETCCQRIRTLTSDENGQPTATWADGQTYRCGINENAGRDIRSRGAIGVTVDAFLRLPYGAASVVKSWERVAIKTKNGITLAIPVEYEIDSLPIDGLLGCTVELRRVVEE